MVEHAVPELRVDAHLDIDDLVVLQAADVVLAVEVLAPSSRRRDRATKLEIYAGMGIPHYWIVDRSRSPRTSWKAAATAKSGAPPATSPSSCASPAS